MKIALIAALSGRSSPWVAAQALTHAQSGRRRQR